MQPGAYGDSLMGENPEIANGVIGYSLPVTM